MFTEASDQRGKSDRAFPRIGQAAHSLATSALDTFSMAAKEHTDDIQIRISSYTYSSQVDASKYLKKVDDRVNNSSFYTLYPSPNLSSHSMR